MELKKKKHRNPCAISKWVSPTCSYNNLSLNNSIMNRKCTVQMDDDNDDDDGA